MNEGSRPGDVNFRLYGMQLYVEVGGCNGGKAFVLDEAGPGKSSEEWQCGAGKGRTLVSVHMSSQRNSV